MLPTAAAVSTWASNNTEAAAALEEFGRAVGVAFQITDDVLDYTGTVDVMGKRAGKDLVERKLTLPLLFACQQDPSILDTLRAGRPEPSEVPRLLEQVIATGGPEQALAYAGTRVEDGLKALAKLSPSPHRDALASLAHFLVDRVR